MEDIDNYIDQILIRYWFNHPYYDLRIYFYNINIYIATEIIYTPSTYFNYSIIFRRQYYIIDDTIQVCSISTENFILKIDIEEFQYKTFITIIGNSFIEIIVQTENDRVEYIIDIEEDT